MHQGLNRRMNATPGRRIGQALTGPLQGRLMGRGTGSLLDAGASAAGLHRTEYDSQGNPINATLGFGDTLAGLGTLAGGIRGAGGAISNASRLRGRPAPGSFGQSANAAGRAMQQVGGGAENALTSIPRGLWNVARGRPYSPGGSATTLQNIGAAGALGGATVLGMPRVWRGVGDTIGNHAMQTVASQSGPLVQGALDMADTRVQQALNRFGATDENGRFSLGRLLMGSGGEGEGGGGGIASTLQGGADHILRALGMNPERMSTTQKALLLGGGALGAGGLAAGAPLVGGAGALAALAGAMPQGGRGWFGGEQAPQRPQQEPRENEWQIQQRIQR